MSDIAEALRKQRATRYQRNRIRSTATASATLIPQQVYSAPEIQSYRSWKGDFDEGYDSRWNSVNKLRDRYDDLYARRLESLGEDVTGDDVLSDPGIEQIISNARRIGVKKRWMFERYFAQEGGPGTREVLGYIDRDGTPQTYDDRQYSQLANSRKAGAVEADGSSLHGHHKNSVKAGIRDDPSSIDHLSDPDNIRLMHGVAHRDDPVYGHGGDTSNPTTGRADEVSTRYTEIVDQNKATTVDNAFDREPAFALGAGLVAGSLGAAVRLYKLRKDPRPWKKKVALGAETFARRAVEGSLVAFAAIGTRDHVADFVVDSADQWVDITGEGVSEVALTEILGSASGIGVAVALRSGIVFIREVYDGASWQKAGTQFGKQLIVIGGEQLAFVIVGLAADAVTPIPDPYIGPTITGLRLAYSLGKLAKNYRTERKSQRECTDRRVAVLYEIAATGLVEVAP